MLLRSSTHNSSSSAYTTSVVYIQEVRNRCCGTHKLHQPFSLTLRAVPLSAVFMSSLKFRSNRMCNPASQDHTDNRRTHPSPRKALQPCSYGACFRVVWQEGVDYNVFALQRRSSEGDDPPRYCCAAVSSRESTVPHAGAMPRTRHNTAVANRDHMLFMDISYLVLHVVLLTCGSKHVKQQQQQQQQDEVIPEKTVARLVVV